jgi:putative protein-disulfide isomerase
MLTIVYANDPLCGWCFAIGPDLLAAKKQLGDSVNWRLEMGGLVVGERVRPIQFDANYLVNGFAQVERACGRKPGQAYWDKVVRPGTWVSNSEPVCRAVFAAQAIAPHLAIEFSHGLTDALYVDGQHPDEAATIGRVATELGIEAEPVIQNWSNAGALASTQERFEKARRLGVAGYPSLFVEHNGQLKLLVSGYATAQHIIQVIRSLQTAGAQ